jgi:cytochrome c-type biogenesis protein
VVFGTFGLVIAPLTSSIEQYLPAVTVVIGVGLIGLGGWLLAGRELTLLLPKPGRGAPTRRLGSMFGYGLAYALASLSCTIGPFLAVTTATFRADSLLAGVRPDHVRRRLCDKCPVCQDFLVFRLRS